MPSCAMSTTKHLTLRPTPNRCLITYKHKNAADSARSTQTVAVDGSQSSDFVQVTPTKMKPKVKDCKKTLGGHGKSPRKDSTDGGYVFNCAESKPPKKAVGLDQCLTCKFSNAYCMCRTSVGNSYENNKQFSSFSALEELPSTVSVISDELNTANVSTVHSAGPGQSSCPNPSCDVTNSCYLCTSGSIESATHPEQCVLPSYQKHVTDINRNQTVSGVTSLPNVTSEPDRDVLRNQTVSGVTSLSNVTSEPDRTMSRNQTVSGVTSISGVTSLSRAASEPGRIVSTLRSKTPDPKPVLSKRKRRSGKRSKSVTFSDNIAYIGTLDEAAPTIDYIAYATEFLGRCQSRLSRQEEAEPDSSESEEDSYVPPTPDNSTEDKVRCNLCRRKFINTSEVYCADCGHYMSKFHVPSS